MSKFSVKKPFTVLVGVIMVLVLGYVAFTKMSTDLLPSMSLPVMEVIVTYPGASPEKVEAEVTEVLEGSLGTVSGIESISSTSSENYAMITLRFEENMDMDAAMAKVSRNLELITLPDNCGSPMLLELSMDMMPTMYTGVVYDGKDIYELTDFTDDTLVPYMKRQEGVANVNAMGSVIESVVVELNQDKIDAVNDKVLLNVNDKLADAKKKIEEGQSELDNAKKQIKDGQDGLQNAQEKQAEELAKFSKQLDQAMATKAAYEAQLTTLQASKSALKAEKDAYVSAYKQVNDGLAAMASQMGVPGLPTTIEEALANDGAGLAMLQQILIAAGQEQMAAQFDKDTLTTLSEKYNKRVPQIDTELANLETEILVQKEMVKAINESIKSAEDAYIQVEAGKITAAAAFGAYTAQMAQAETALNDGQAQLDQAMDSFEESAKTARESANLDALLNMATLSQILTAQNFDMPAGYIETSKNDDTQYLLKVGEQFETMDEFKDMVLCNIDGVGDVKLSDVADITVIDNADESYVKINGQKAVVLAVYKGSTAYTADVSKRCEKAYANLEEQYEGLHFINVMDQGDYIDLIVKSVMQNLLVGAVLAILVLLLFLRDPRPTAVVAFSIPLSVLFAVVLMYFTNITLNMISLSGLALGIGMLVDNSIVVIENIYRLRNNGVSAARAAVMGAKQVGGAVIASTLTTICVFLPIVFTNGITRELMQDMCLTIAYSLTASLVVALTVVPAMSSTLLKNQKEIKHKWFDAVAVFYGKILDFCLKVKIVPLAIAIVLLVFSIWQVVRMGIVIMPEMDGNQMSVQVSFPDESDIKDDVQMMDDLMKAIDEIDGVDMEGAISANSITIGGLDMGSVGVNKAYQIYIMFEEDKEVDNAKVADEIEAYITENMSDVEYEISESDMDMSALMASGLQIEIYGQDIDKLLEISEDVMDMVGQVEGFDEISNGQEEASDLIKVVVDKDKAMKNSLTVAQIYAALAQSLNTETSATALEIDDKTYSVTIKDTNNQLTVDDLMDYEFEVDAMDDDGKAIKETHKLSEFAEREDGKSVASIRRDNQSRYMIVSAVTKEGYNTVLQGREVQKLVEAYDLPDGYTIKMAGETESTNEMLKNMLQMILLAVTFVYLVMVAQFQSLKSPFIVIFTMPLAFTGGLIGLLLFREQLSMLALMGFLVLAGVVVNNGIVFVDYANQLRMAGMKKRAALIETGKTRMRPILMTTLTTILAMSTMLIGKDMGTAMGRGMSIVVIGGLTYATLMTLFIVPVLYDIFYRKPMKVVDIGSEENLDDISVIDIPAELMEESFLEGDEIPVVTEAVAEDVSDAQEEDPQM